MKTIINFYLKDKKTILAVTIYSLDKEWRLCDNEYRFPFYIGQVFVKYYQKIEYVFWNGSVYYH